MIEVGDPQTGAPPKADVYIVRYRFGMGEVYAYCDGKRWSRAQPDAWTAGQMEKRLDEGGRLPRSQRAWRPVLYWRTYHSDGKEFADLLRAKINGEAG